GDTLSDEDRAILRAYAYKLKHNLTESAFQDLHYVFPNTPLLSLHQIKARLAFLSGLTPSRYDCCVQSCMAYTGPLADLQECPHCRTSRYDEYGKARRQYSYLSLKARPLAMRRNRQTAEGMQYRGEYIADPAGVRDVFDSAHYKDLCGRRVVIHGRDLGVQFFSDPRDVALGLSTDGFAPWRRRKKT
ncbi:hypothetical protein C8Q76DRAFT_585319, partial [Earliella scabrosa]